MAPNGILDPTAPAAQPAPSEQVRAERRSNLEGLRVGLLDNTKHNALLFLKEVGNLLTEEYGAEEVSIIETKQNFSIPVDEEIISRYKVNADVVVIGIGDCGSCSAAAVADGINFEKGGLPAAVVLTDAFDSTGRTMAKLHGDESYEWITTEHPVAPLPEQQVKERAQQLSPSIVATLTGA